MHFLALLLDRKKTIITMHDCTLLMNNHYNPLKKFFYKLLWFTLPSICCRQIIAVSEETKKNLVRYAGMGKDEITIIYHGLEKEFKRLKISKKQRIALLKNPSSKPTILHISNSAPNKNFKTLVAALRGLDIKLVKVGSMDKQERNLVDKMGIDCVQFLNISLENVIKIYNFVDCLVYPSLIEGFGLPIIEAQACGCPVITSNVSSMPEIAGKGALFVNPRSSDEIREAILSVLRCKKLKNQLVKDGLKNINRFKWEDTAQKYYDIYKKIYSDNTCS